MSELQSRLNEVNIDGGEAKVDVVSAIQTAINASGYETVEVNEEKPWGAYFRLNSSQADDFVQDFFPEMNAIEARLGDPDAELSPKLLLVSPSQRLSWQYHNRRAERWVFLTEGGYNKSLTDDPGAVVEVSPGVVVQFEKSERHRLVGLMGKYAIVAEIWQHTDSANPSNEEDIIRLADDYSR